MKVIDCITWNGETDLFDLRYNILKPHVDEFIVVEFDKTFSGKPKKPSFPTEKYPDVTYRFHTEELYGKYKDLAYASKNTLGADHWKVEFQMKESIKDALTHLDDEDIVFVGDCDEIWEPKAIKMFHPSKLKLRVYTYYLDNRSSEVFWGTLVARYWEIKKECLNEMRSTPLNKTEFELGWHFTSLKDGLKKKLEDSYTPETYANKWVMDNLDKNIEENRDFLGRSFTYKIDTSEWPDYLKDHKEEYRHLLKC